MLTIPLRLLWVAEGKKPKKRRKKGKTHRGRREDGFKYHEYDCLSQPTTTAGSWKQVPDVACQTKHNNGMTV